MTGRIVVINPNSNEQVTADISAALDCLRFADGPALDCLTLAEGPIGIETARDTEMVVSPLCALIRREDNAADAFVIACFGDPGLAAARETTRKPVFGICEAGIASVINRGERYGIVATTKEAINSELRQLRAMGFESRLAGVEAIGIPVTGLGDHERVFAGMVEAGRRLVDDGAEALTMDCAGMTRHCRPLEEKLGVPVVDPTRAAVGMALAAVAA